MLVKDQFINNLIMKIKLRKSLLYINISKNYSYYSTTSIRNIKDIKKNCGGACKSTYKTDKCLILCLFEYYGNLI